MPDSGSLSGDGSVGADSDAVLAEMAFTEGALGPPLLGWRPSSRPCPVAGSSLESRLLFRGALDWRSGFGRLGRVLEGLERFWRAWKGFGRVLDLFRMIY